MRYLVSLIMALPMLASACDICNCSDPGKVYLTPPTEVRIIDDLDIIITPTAIVLTQQVDLDSCGFYYLTSHVIKVVLRDTRQPLLYPTCDRCGAAIPTANACPAAGMSSNCPKPSILLSAGDDGYNYDGGVDCGGCDANGGRCDWSWGPHDGGCHGPVVGSPGANGMLQMIDYYPSGANGPAAFLDQ